jgi:hypothetical protein
MATLPQLARLHLLLKAQLCDYRACVAWALELLQEHESTEDSLVLRLAGATEAQEATDLVARLLDRNSGNPSLDEQFVAGKYVAQLREDYIEGKETIASLDAKFTLLYVCLDYPEWLTILSRNCEYAQDVHDFEEPFEQEFTYVANLWASVQSRASFECRYSRSVSDQHDAAFLLSSGAAVRKLRELE